MKRTFSTELAYVFGIVFVARGVVLMEKADFGVSMVVAPAYLLYRWLSPVWSFVTFGMAEYCLQAVLLLAMCLLLRFRVSYLFSFVTAVVYGFVLDAFILLGAALPAGGVWLRAIYYVLGMLFCAAGVSAICSPHRTLESIFSDLILGDIREKARLITLDEDAVIAEIKSKKQADTTSEQKASEKKLQSLRHRLSELERLISKLYEEMVLGDIPREMVLDMMDKYKKEQQEKSILAAQLAEQLTHSQEVDNDIREWVSLIRKCMRVKELDRELLIKLVDKIIVGQKAVINGMERQEITIVYNLVGKID